MSAPASLEEGGRGRAVMEGVEKRELPLPPLALRAAASLRERGKGRIPTIFHAITTNTYKNPLCLPVSADRGGFCIKINAGAGWSRSDGPCAARPG